MAFVPLFCQSHHSPRGVAPPRDLARRARGLGYGTLGLVDEATIAAFTDFDVACTEQGIRPVFGCRLPLAGFAITSESFPVDFLIETEQGYRNLVRLLTRHHRKGEGSKRSLEAGDLAAQAQGLCIVIPPDGELAALVRLRNRTKTETFLEQVVAVCGAGLTFGVALDAESPEAARAAAQMTLRLAQFVHARVIAAPPVRYPEPGDAASAVYLDHPLAAPDRAYTPPKDLKALPALWPEADVLTRWSGEFVDLPHATGDLARRCAWRPSLIRRVFPSLDLERGFDPNSYLFDLAIRGATQRYGEITEPLKQRINKEFEELRSTSMAGYMLLCYQIAQALDQRGIARGVGRGRLIASVIAYCLGISRIDPLEYKLASQPLAETRDAIPELLVEVPRSGVAPLLDWMREAFGADHLAEIGRIQETSRQQMINDLAAWASMQDEERRMVHRERARMRSTGAASRLSELAEGTKSRRWRDPAFLGDLVARLAPRPRGWTGMGDHFALSGDPLESVVPRVQSQQGRPVTGLEEAGIETLGLARIVFTPHALLDILDQAAHSARALHPHTDLRQIPLNDRATFELLARGQTSGIPPLEGPTMRSLLRRVKPTNIMQLWRIKNEARARHPGAPGAERAGERSHELADELPDVLLSYQCAYLKANYPLAFYGAAIGAVVDQRGNPAALLREARRGGYEVEPPDVNLSDWGPVVHSGCIRLGLAAIRNFGRRAWENVFSVRSGGNFTTLENFCERIDPQVLNVRMLRSMIAAGALDSLDQNRATMDALVGRLQRRVRGRGRPSQNEDKQATLFDLEALDDGEQSEASEAAAPAAPPAPLAEWNAWERVQHESEALGFPLGIDPIARYRIPLEHLRPLQVDQVGARMIGRSLRVAGLVGRVEAESPLIKAPGEMYLDLEGLPVRLPPALANVSVYCLEPANEVLVVGVLRRGEGYHYLEAEGIWTLADIEEQGTTVGSVHLDLSGENRDTLALLLRCVAQYPGSATLRLHNYPGNAGWKHRRLSHRRIFFCSPLYQALCTILPPQCVTLYGLSGERLVVQPPASEGELEDLEPITQPVD